MAGWMTGRFTLHQFLQAKCGVMLANRRCIDSASKKQCALDWQLLSSQIGTEAKVGQHGAGSQLANCCCTGGATRSHSPNQVHNGELTTTREGSPSTGGCPLNPTRSRSL